jgi:NTP pyrophosphatase (non-canonical NTP hydrolase)
MTLNEYQSEAEEFALYQSKMYPVTSLMIEAAELADLFVKPYLRGDRFDVDLEEVISEAGDVLWNLANILSDLDITLCEVAEANLAKLHSRQARGVIMGRGGDR